MIKKLILIHNSETVESLREIVLETDRVFWIYFGRDYSDMLKWRKYLLRVARQIEYGKELQLKAIELRRQFLDFVAETGCQNSKFVQWSSSVFEKNSIGSPLFLYICYLEVLKDYLVKNNEAETMIVISESWPLIQTIQNNFICDTTNIIILDNFDRTLSIFKDYIKIVIRPFVFVYRCLLEYFAAVFSREKSSYSKNSNIKSQAAKNIIVKTWVSDKFFNNDGKFKDVYFNTLSDWLVESGYNVKLLPVLMNSEMPIKKIMPFIRKKENKFLVLWDYLKPVDIFKAIGKGLGQLSLKFNKFEFKGLNIKKLLKQQRRSFALSNRGLNCILQYYFFERLSKKSFKIDRVIYTFENMLPEKLFIIAIRTFYPNTKIVGFQHSVLYPLHLALYISENEADSAPLPDKIVCSGEFFKKIFSNEYYPSDILKTGPALRFGYLFDKQHNQDESYGNKVMLVLPGYKSEALYLLVKTLSALKDEDIVVHIKPHPLTDLEDVRHVMEKVGFSHQKIVIEKKALQELTGQCGLMITVSSSVIFDAIASGVPVLRVKKEIDLDLDPADWLDYDPKRDFVAFSSEDIRVEVKRALSLNKHERDSLKYYAKRFIEETFSPITENTLSVFVKQ